MTVTREIPVCCPQAGEIVGAGVGAPPDVAARGHDPLLSIAGTAAMDTDRAVVAHPDNIPAVPLPPSAALMLAALVALVMRRRRA